MKGGVNGPRFSPGRAARGALLAIGVLALAACGHHSSSSSSYTVGGTITGLTSGDVVLIYNDSTTVTVDAGATTWTFPGSFTAGGSYSVSVQTQPSGELCEVTGGGSGDALTSNISDVTVVCSRYGQWVWEAGARTINASGVYGTLGAASASNLPGARYAGSSWTDSSGNFWLFGGLGYSNTGTSGYLSDLWEYSPSTGEWTWVKGPSGQNTSGLYGVLGSAADANSPGGRYAATTWTDSSGNLWLFGGYGYDRYGTLGRLNDLWRFNPSIGEWTWMSGGNAASASGVYGTQGTAATGNVPGARYSASAWIDSSGNLWMFGGSGYDASGDLGNLNDLWEYSPSSGEWTWVAGGSGDDAVGVYGTQGSAAAGNVPGARQAANAWLDSSGDLWLFGGYGTSASAVGSLNDLWEFSPTTGMWTWVNGADSANASGTYGTQGSAAAGNGPGARYSASSWIDSSGNLWMFGGVGYDAASAAGSLNDLWEYSPSSGEWNWVSGGSADNSAGVYGTQGSANSASNTPGSRYFSNTWVDSSGDLWLFGGAGYASSGNGYLNDLWKFIPP